MLDFIQNDLLFWTAALGGSILFFLQLIISLIGFDDEGLDSSDHDFKWLSKQSITGFIMMFGWAGLTCSQEFGMSKLMSVVIGAIAGLATFFITGLIFRLARKLSSPGTPFRIEESLGKEATVYLRIPPNGTGKISITLQDHLHEIDAITTSPDEIPSFTSVEIVSIKDPQTVTVIPKGAKL